VAGDGNRLFQSLSLLLEGDESQNTPPRKGAADNVSVNYDQFCEFVKEDYGFIYSFLLKCQRGLYYTSL
jgi:hypothetical protein